MKAKESKKVYYLHNKLMRAENKMPDNIFLPNGFEPIEGTPVYIYFDPESLKHKEFTEESVYEELDDMVRFNRLPEIIKILMVKLRCDKYRYFPSRNAKLHVFTFTVKNQHHTVEVEFIFRQTEIDENKVVWGDILVREWQTMAFRYANAPFVDTVDVITHLANHHASALKVALKEQHEWWRK
jgi:hypothetical protein